MCGNITAIRVIWIAFTFPEGRQEKLGSSKVTRICSFESHISAAPDTGQWWLDGKA